MIGGTKERDEYDVEPALPIDLEQMLLPYHRIGLNGAVEGD